LIDNVLEYLCSKSVSGWTGLLELAGVMRRFGLSQEESTEIIEFLRKYFVEVDESKQKVKMSSCAISLFENPIS
jgi:hypothetical protein